MHAFNAQTAQGNIKTILAQLDSISDVQQQELEVDLAVLRGSLNTALKKLEAIEGKLPQKKRKKSFFSEIVEVDHWPPWQSSYLSNPVVSFGDQYQASQEDNGSNP
jgi:hypothetical protein